MKSIFESLIVFAIMTCILLPARLVFVEYVTDDWLGSFGIISAISLFVIILARKKKLGFFGEMLERQIYKFQKGKRGLVVFGESVFLLLILGVMIFAIDQGNTVYSDINTQNIQNIPNSSSQIIDYTEKWTASDWINGFLMAPIAFVTVFPEMSAVIASIDQRLDGWLMHFYTVGFVEYVELLGIFLFYRISFNRITKIPTKTVYSKMPIV